MRLLEIGEAVKGISPELTATEPDIQWSDIAGMRLPRSPLLRNEARDHPAHHRQAPGASRRSRRAHEGPPAARGLMAHIARRPCSASSRIALMAPAARRRIEREDIAWASFTSCVTDGVISPPRPRRPGASICSAAWARSSRRSRTLSTSLPESIPRWRRSASTSLSATSSSRVRQGWTQRRRRPARSSPTPHHDAWRGRRRRARPSTPGKTRSTTFLATYLSSAGSCSQIGTDKA